MGEFKALALPYKFLGWDNPEIGAPPALGADTDRVLRGDARLFRRKDREAEEREGDMSAVLYSVADGVATLTLNRPESRNALNLEMCEGIIELQRELPLPMIR